MTVTSALRVVWITGLSGAGKSTVARALQHALGERGIRAVVLDGDEVRAAINDTHVGHDRASRLVNAYRISRLAQLIASQGVTVVVATMSLFHEIHDWNAANLPGYFEVFLRVPLEALRRRDPKGLYRGAAAGSERHVAGVDLDVEVPRQPHLVIDNGVDNADFAPLAMRILREAFGDVGG